MGGVGVRGWGWGCLCVEDGGVWVGGGGGLGWGGGGEGGTCIYVHCKLSEKQENHQEHKTRQTNGGGVKS